MCFLGLDRVGGAGGLGRGLGLEWRWGKEVERIDALRTEAERSFSKG